MHAGSVCAPDYLQSLAPLGTSDISCLTPSAVSISDNHRLLTDNLPGGGSAEQAAAEFQIKSCLHAVYQFMVHYL